MEVLKFVIYFSAGEIPTVVSGLVGKQITQISCGSNYSAAVTSDGELYTWGRGNYGRLGHGNSDGTSTPHLVQGLREHKIVDVSCGSGDAQTLALDEEG